MKGVELKLALSFKDSMKMQNEKTVSTIALNEYGVASYSSPVIYAEDEFQKSDKYKWYDDYSDDDICTIDTQKNIHVNSNQINITQESNSQYIPFQMPRYYDGMDLMKMVITIHYCTSQEYEGYKDPINVLYSNDTIKFGWLVDKNATAHEGTLQFEVHATGVNSHEDEYVWITKINSQLNILRSLHGNGVVEPDQSWTDSFFEQINEKVGEAQKYAKQAEEAASNAANDAVEKLKDEIGDITFGNIDLISCGDSKS